MGSFGPMEILVIFLVILLLFGAKRIPEIAKGLGKGIREFKQATREISDEINAASNEVNAARRIQPPHQPATPRSTPAQSQPVNPPENAGS